jgi:cytochrome c peroxidase
MNALLLALLLEAAPVCAPSGQVCRPGTASTHLRSSGAAGVPDTLGRGHWLVDEENDEVLRVNESRVERFEVGRWPEQLVVTRDGRAIVSCREAGQLAVIARDGSVRRIDVGPEPKALALDETARRLYVGLVTAQEALAFDLDSFEPVARAPLPFEPLGFALSGDVLVIGSRKSPELVLLDPASLAERWRVAIPGRGTSVARVEALAAIGGDLLVAARLTETGIAQAPSSNEGGGYGGVRVPQPFNVALFVLRDPGGGYHVPDFVNLTFLTEVTATAVAGDRVYLASRGARQVAVATLAGPMAPLRFSAAAWAPAVVALSVEETGALAALDGHRRRAIVSPAFGHGARPVAVPPSRLDAQLREGRELFLAIGDKRLSSRAMGCVSCHPDGREDGLVWRLQGTARQTPMLAKSRLEGTAPYNWLGSAETLEANLEQTIVHRLMGSGLQPGELAALTRYVREGLRPVRVPAPEEPLAARGRELFSDASVGCATCHPAELQFTDGLRHDVESMSATEQPRTPRRLWRAKGVSVENPELFGGAYDTPSLLGLSATAPYFHDGSAATLDEVLEHNGDRMGVTSHLSAEDRAALVAYLKTL